jgi:chorismate mutase
MGNTMMCRGVRGATTAREDSADAIFEATQALLTAMVEANGIDTRDVASAIFSASPDLTAAYPAAAAREIGWEQVPLLGTREMDVPGGIRCTIRVLLHWNTTKSQDEIVHIYQGEAARLRPDLVQRVSSK